jgi:hypothetical protein
MKNVTLIGMAIGVLGSVMSTAQAAIAYTIQFETHYAFGAPSDGVAGQGGSPDAGFLRFVNTGTTTFSGTFSLTGLAPTQNLNVTFNGTLAPGAAFSLVAGPESSNQGGYNKVTSGPDLGILIAFSGSVSDSNGSEAVSLQAYDSEIHSGVVRTNPFGIQVDNYVLQGGDPFGRDTSDPFETTQATGIAIFSQVPAPGSLCVMALGGLVARRRR